MSNKKCSFKGCDKPIFVKKTRCGPLCNGHYKQYKKQIQNGGIIKLRPLRKYSPNKVTKDCDKCILENCNRPKWGKHEYCQSHQRQIWGGIKKEDLKPIREYTFQINKECSMEGCTEPARAKRLCSKHYGQSRAKLKKIKGK